VGKGKSRKAQTLSFPIFLDAYEEGGKSFLPYAVAFLPIIACIVRQLAVKEVFLLCFNIAFEAILSSPPMTLVAKQRARKSLVFKGSPGYALLTRVVEIGAIDSLGVQQGASYGLLLGLLPNLPSNAERRPSKHRNVRRGRRAGA
jgi:hypothetical protein